jgi:hypothetical protein
VSDTIEAKAGPAGEIVCTYGGDGFVRITGYSAEVVALNTGSLRIKRKKKPEKNGGQEIYLVSPSATSRIELTFEPAELERMEQLVEALFAAGAKTI